MSTDSVYIAGAYEHPERELPETSIAEIHADVARGALADAGLSKDDVDGYLTAGEPYQVGGRFPPLAMTDYLGLDVSYVDSTDVGGTSYVAHVGEAAAAIRDGRCDVALITLANRARSYQPDEQRETYLHENFEEIYGQGAVAPFAMAARRHMHEYGTTSEQLAAVRTAAAHHAQYNDDAMYRDPVSVDDVLDSPVVADPLHLLDCCVVSDGGGALVVVSGEVADGVERECVEVLGHGDAISHHDAGRASLTETAAAESGPRAFADAGLSPEDVDFAALYDAFTILVVMTLEDLGFCPKGAGGEFVTGDTLRAPGGDLPFNTDGGGLCSNHPNRGGMTKVIEAVRQLRGEAAPEVQLDDPTVALAHGVGGGSVGRHACATTLLGRADR